MDLCLNLGEPVDKFTIKQLFDEMDDDGDGEVSSEEFKKWFRTPRNRHHCSGDRSAAKRSLYEMRSEMILARVRWKIRYNAEIRRREDQKLRLTAQQERAQALYAGNGNFKDVAHIGFDSKFQAKLESKLDTLQLSITSLEERFRLE